MPVIVLPGHVIDTLIYPVGIGMRHRAYEPAHITDVPWGWSAGIAVTAWRPIGVGDAIQAVASITSTSASGEAPVIPVIPSATLHVRKSITPHFELGASLLPIPAAVPYVSGYLAGADATWMLYEPAPDIELPYVALRGVYSQNKLSIDYKGQALVTILSVTTGVELLASKPLLGAEPYVGLAFMLARGSLLAQIAVPASPAPAPVIAPISLMQTGMARSLTLFAGIKLRTPSLLGLKLALTLEGAYDPAGAHTIGLKLGAVY